MIIMLLINLFFSLALTIGIFFILKKINSSDKKIEIEKSQDKLERTLKEELFRFNELIRNAMNDNMESMRNSMGDNAKNQLDRLNLIFQNQDTMLKMNSDSLHNMTQNNAQGMTELKKSLENQLQFLRNENTAQLEKMRNTVDEKLQSTLEQRLSSSFKQVGDRLDAVNLGLGEMQKMASDVGNLQRVLTNVKNKGILGEVQLNRILDDILIPEQYVKNVKTKKEGNCFVEFAIKLPNRDVENTPLWLPIDAKFPTEDYSKLQEAYDQNDPQSIVLHSKNLEQKIKLFAKDIKEKYIDPPHTTEFAILFLPTEGLFSEVLRMNGLSEYCRRELSVVITGPTTIAAFLNSLHMGFKTLAVEKRSTEIAKLLGAVKTDFSKFGDLLEKTQKKLDEASKQIGDASHRSKQISRKLVKVESLPAQEASQILELSSDDE